MRRHCSEVFGNCLVPRVTIVANIYQALLWAGDVPVPSTRYILSSLHQKPRVADSFAIFMLRMRKLSLRLSTVLTCLGTSPTVTAFPSLPHLSDPLSKFPGIVSERKHLHLNPHLRVFFWGNLNWDKYYTQRFLRTDEYEFLNRKDCQPSVEHNKWRGAKSSGTPSVHHN